MDLVAFSGYARAGKDEAARALVSIGWHRIAFADNVREFLYRLNPILEAGDYECRIRDVIDRHTWDGYKNTVYGEEIRSLLQRLGVDCGRNLMGENIWVDSAFKDLKPSGQYVVTDCRFENEADGVRTRGGKVFRIIRPGVGPANSHMSETALDDYEHFSGVILNDGTKDQFHERVIETVSNS